MELSLDSELGHRRASAARTPHNRSHGGLAIAAVAGVAIVGAIGVWMLRRKERKSGVATQPEIDNSLTGERTPEGLYESRKNPAIFQRTFGHFARMDALDHQRAGWSAGTPLGEWHMRLVENRVGELMRWQPEEPAPLRKSSVVSFRRVAGRAPS